MERIREKGGADFRQLLELDDLFSRLILPYKDQLATRITQLGSLLNDRELKRLELREWNDGLSSPDFLLRATGSYLLRHLSKNALIEFFLHQTVWHHSNEVDKERGDPFFLPKVYQLYKTAGRVDNAAYELLCSATAPYLRESEWRIVLDKLKSWPASETKFFLVAHGKEEPLYGLFHRSMEWQFLTHPIAKGRVEERWQLVVPPQLLNELFQARFPESFMSAEPAVGYSPNEPMDNPKARVVFLPCTLLPPLTDPLAQESYLLSEEVHGYRGSPLAVYHHDIYHLAVEAANPHRAIWIKWACFLADKHEEKAKGIARDRDFFYYLKENLTKEVRFWLVLGAHLQRLTTKQNSMELPLVLFTSFYKENRQLFMQYQLMQKPLKDSCDYLEERIVNLLNDKDNYDLMRYLWIKLCLATLEASLFDMKSYQ